VAISLVSCGLMNTLGNMKTQRVPNSRSRFLFPYCGGFDVQRYKHSQPLLPHGCWEM